MCLGFGILTKMNDREQRLDQHHQTSNISLLSLNVNGLDEQAKCIAPLSSPAIRCQLIAGKIYIYYKDKRLNIMFAECKTAVNNNNDIAFYTYICHLFHLTLTMIKLLQMHQVFYSKHS